MTINKNTDDYAENPKDSPKGLRWVVIGGGIAWAILLAVAIWHPGITARVKFFSDSTLNLFVVLAVIAQVFIYRRMATQNERLIKSSESSTKVAREAFHTGEAPYFGIPEIAFTDFATTRWPQAKVVLLNGGKTPAWRIHTFAKLVLGDSPDKGDSWNMELRAPAMVHTFFPGGVAHQFDYAQNGFCLTEAREIMIRAGTQFLFMVIEIHYRDFRKTWHSQIFRAVWYPHGIDPGFHDYDASGKDCAMCRRKGYAG